MLPLVTLLPCFNKTDFSVLGVNEYVVAALYPSVDERVRQHIFDKRRYGAFQRSCAVNFVVAFIDDNVRRAARNFKFYSVIGKAFYEFFKQNVYNFSAIFSRKAAENDYIVQPV